MVPEPEKIELEPEKIISVSADPVSSGVLFLTVVDDQPVKDLIRPCFDPCDWDDGLVTGDEPHPPSGCYLGRYFSQESCGQSFNSWIFEYYDPSSQREGC